MRSKRKKSFATKEGFAGKKRKAQSTKVRKAKTVG